MAFDPTVLGSLSVEEWRALVDYAIAEITRAQQAEADTEATNRELVIQSIQSLEGLLGDPSEPAYDPGNPETRATIASVKKHPPEVLEAHSGVVLQLLLEGMGILTVSAIAVAGVVRASTGR